jgi:hypothetical protein
VGSDLGVGIVLKIVADDNLRSRGEFSFGMNVGTGDVMKGSEGLLMIVGNIGNIEAGFRVRKKLLSEFL